MGDDTCPESLERLGIEPPVELDETVCGPLVDVVLADTNIFELVDEAEEIV